MAKPYRSIKVSDEVHTLLDNLSGQKVSFSDVIEGILTGNVPPKNIKKR